MRGGEGFVESFGFGPLAPAPGESGAEELGGEGFRRAGVPLREEVEPFALLAEAADSVRGAQNPGAQQCPGCLPFRIGRGGCGGALADAACGAGIHYAGGGVEMSIVFMTCCQQVIVSENANASVGVH